MIKRSWIEYRDNVLPMKNSHFVIQKKFLWFWWDMQFDNYGASKMTFSTFEEADKYAKELRKIYG